MNKSRRLWIALPAMNEFDYISDTLECIRKQTYKNICLVACVNQPEYYYDDEKYRHIIENNKKTIHLLNEISDFECIIIDRTSKGKGWKEKYMGVGWARKEIFDVIMKLAGNEDIVISMDADTKFQETYFDSVLSVMSEFPQASALAVPFYHLLSGDDTLDRAMMRYELYVRYYSVNLFRIHSPYAPSALGSAMAFTVVAYRKMRGLTPKSSGEDFYLLQKLRKNGYVLSWLNEFVYPGTRFSDRVFFGTGPALIKGKTGNWSAYPFFQPASFDAIASFYSLCPQLFAHTISTPVDDFFQNVHKIETIKLWELLRENSPDETRFVHACHLKFDGLRILQFLRYNYDTDKKQCTDEEQIVRYLSAYHPHILQQNEFIKNFSFSFSKIDELDGIRNMFKEIEMNYRKDEYEKSKKWNNKSDISKWKYLYS